jgi:hypothetical protein
MLKVKRHVNHFIFQIVHTYRLSCLVFVTTNISGHLTTHVHCADTAGDCA